MLRKATPDISSSRENINSIAHVSRLSFRFFLLCNKGQKKKKRREKVTWYGFRRSKYPLMLTKEMYNTVNVTCEVISQSKYWRNIFNNKATCDSKYLPTLLNSDLLQGAPNKNHEQLTMNKNNVYFLSWSWRSKRSSNKNNILSSW